MRISRTLPRLGLLLALLLTAACTRVAPVRTLPTWVRGIYVPVFANKSFEPGLEDTATKAVQRAFIEDGRVDIVPKRDADLVLQGTIMDWTKTVSNTSNDHIATNDEVVMTVALQLFEPLNMERPLADLGLLKIRGAFYGDIRSVDFRAEPRQREDLMTQLGIVARETVITGFPVQLQYAPPGAMLPQTQSADQLDPDKPLRPRNETEIQQ